MVSPFYIGGIIGEGDARAETLAAFLRSNPGRAEVVINSPGGDAFEGAAMLAEIGRHGGVTVHMQGVVASAASLAAMGGRDIVIDRDAVFMLHDPSGLTFGPAADHRKTAQTLDKLSETYAASYARTSGNSVSMVREWMLAETWLDAEETLALNFADRIDGGSRPVAVAQFDFTRFRNPPAHLVRMAVANGWTAESSEPKHEEKTDA